MKVWRNFSEIITLESSLKKDGRRLLPEDLSLINNGSIVFDETKIIWVGKDSKLPNQYKKLRSKNFKGQILLPEIVDSHTHLLFAGDRADEYLMRLNGATYQEIATAGGGILKTSHSTNNASDKDLLKIARQRIKKINSYGVGTIEIKSGYSLTYDGELRLSRLINKLKKEFAPDIQIIRTFMAAHAVPKGLTSAEFVSMTVLPLLDKVVKERLIDAVDLFHEEGYFSTEDAKAIFDRAQLLNIPVKSHADEFKDNNGAALAASYHALSTDHLLAIGAQGIEALANSKTVATLLPGTGFFLGKRQCDGRRLLDSGVKVAIASDYNPGSCHWDNLMMIARLAAPLYKMNIAELVAAITMNSAHALNLKNQGAIVAGLAPRFSIFKEASIAKIFYRW